MLASFHGLKVTMNGTYNYDKIIKINDFLQHTASSYDAQDEVHNQMKPALILFHQIFVYWTYCQLYEIHKKNCELWYKFIIYV